jgi:hypothetical protein
LSDHATEGNPVEVSSEIEFAVETGRPTIGSVVLAVPAGDYSCITARDPLHSLKSSDESFHWNGTRYMADFTGDPAQGGDWLTQGNLNGDDIIDMDDFMLFTEQWATHYGTGNTTCETTGPHADFTGDGIVTVADFTFIQINFLQSSDPPCSP